MKIFKPAYWQEYEIIDSGNFKKLERFGDIITIRPEPQAVWDSSMTYEEWKKIASVEYIPINSNSGKWEKYKNIPDNWFISYNINGSNEKKLNFKLALTSFKHIGLFPEQAVNWEFIYNECITLHEPKVLNLFAYTGVASIVAAYAKAKVTHVDSVKQIINWAAYNAKLNNIDSIRWIVDDAVKFVNREIRRGNRYHGIILDPPAFGHGPNGENWKLERDINKLLKSLEKIRSEDNFFLVLNVYSLGFSALVLENLIKTIFKPKQYDFGELFVEDKWKKKLPLGIFVQLKT
jgi:23S rRNA (cytosine1962-C5)-methyltransferase